jgi:cytochrome P450
MFTPAVCVLGEEDAAVELINVLRPTVAVARFITFAALALHEHPGARQKLQEGDEEYLERFVQEVRRFYPFFPLVGGRARKDFEWRGHRFEEGTWVLLDPRTLPGVGRERLQLHPAGCGRPLPHPPLRGGVGHH